MFYYGNISLICCYIIKYIGYSLLLFKNSVTLFTSNNAKTQHRFEEYDRRLSFMQLKFLLLPQGVCQTFVTETIVGWLLRSDHVRIRRRMTRNDSLLLGTMMGMYRVVRKVIGSLLDFSVLATLHRLCSFRFSYLWPPIWNALRSTFSLDNR